MVILPSIRRKYMVSRIPWGATVPMSECVVTLASDRASYTGAARTVGVTVTWEGATLAVNTDYTLSFANNTNIGPATVTVTGMGQFAGSVTRTFYIVSAGSGAWIDFDLDKTTFVGKSATPVVDVPSGWERVRAVSPDGKTLFPMHKKLYAVSLASPMSLASYASAASGSSDVFSGNDAGKSSIAWSSDGLHYVMSGYRLNPNAVMEYGYFVAAGSVSSPFSINGVSFSDYKIISLPSGMVSVSQDGMYIFLSYGFGTSVAPGTELGAVGLWRMSLASPYSLVGAGDFEQVLVANRLTEETRTLRNIFLSPDGHAMIAVWNRWIQKFTLSTPYDVSTRTLHSAFDPYGKAGDDGGQFCGCVISDDGTKMILYSAYTNELFEFGLAA